ncbi:helix-turn-helix transcriptional regulator [Candidatus Dojkabacteria bacterium]|nr:helix-turn-helix transcriptional regulator [Candidatus Dojkabacteria bacterium]
MRIEKFEKFFNLVPLTPQEKGSDDIAEEIGDMIVELRIINKITQKELAERTGTKQPSIARLEKGTSLPSLKTLYKIAKELGTYLIPPKFGAVEDYQKPTEINERTSEELYIQRRYNSPKLIVVSSPVQEISEKTTVHKLNSQPNGQYMDSFMQ